MLSKKIMMTVVAVAFAGIGAAANMAQADDDSKDSQPCPMMQGGGKGPGGMGGMMGGRGMMGDCPAMMGMMSDDESPSFAEGRIAFLKAELAITDAQKGVWNAYADVVKRNFENMKATRKIMMGAMGDKTPVERLDARIEAMEGRVKMLKEIKPALNSLYSALSDDQRKKANEVMGMGCMM
jgi:hypothetical protein